MQLFPLDYQRASCFLRVQLRDATTTTTTNAPSLSLSPVYQQPRGAGMCPHHRCQTQNRFLDAPSYLASGSPVTFSSPLLLSRLFKRFSPFLLLTLLRISFRNDRVGGSGRREDGWLDGEEAERAEERKPLKWRNLGPCSRGPDLCRFQGSVRLTR